MRRPRLDLVPPHMGNLQPRVSPLDRRDIAADPAQALDGFELAPGIRQQLHPDANAEKRASADHDGFVQCRFETGNGHQPAPAIGERTDAGENDAVSRGNGLRRARHIHLGRNFILAGCALERLGGRAQIARAVIDYRDDHGRLPPSTPLVDGTAPARLGSISTAWRKARARPLKHDSTMW